MSSPMMRIGIDLHNIRDGGGVNYMRNLLGVADPAIHCFESIHLFGAPSVLEDMPRAAFIVHHSQPVLERRLHHRIIWATTTLPRVLRQTGCTLLYVPGGVVPLALIGGGFRPYATISRNMMPFATDLWELYPRGLDRTRLRLLHWVHLKSFARAQAMIYLTDFARNTLEPMLPWTDKARNVQTIPHGLNHSLFKPRPDLPSPAPDPSEPIEVVYCSRLEPYKHQVEVIRAIVSLWPRYPRLRLTMIGWSNKSYEAEVTSLISEVDPGGEAMRYVGGIPNADLPGVYARSHLKLFASSCENLPNTLLEAMASGLPVLSSSASPMPEVADDACLYFDPRSPEDIARSIDAALSDWAATQARVARGIERASAFTWQRCAAATFAVLRDVLSTQKTH
jgi:glycosyltransferase involved in cell wall biosynthesis